MLLYPYLFWSQVFMEFAKEQENEEEEVGSLSTTFQWQRLLQDGRTSVNQSDSIVHQLWASSFSPLSPPPISVCLYVSLQIVAAPVWGSVMVCRSMKLARALIQPAWLHYSCLSQHLLIPKLAHFFFLIFNLNSHPLMSSTYLCYLLAFVNRFIPCSLVSWAYLPSAGWCHTFWISRKVLQRRNIAKSLSHINTIKGAFSFCSKRSIF